MCVFAENEENAAKESNSIDPSLTRPVLEASQPQPIGRPHSASDPAPLQPVLLTEHEVEFNGTATAGSPIMKYPTTPVRHNMGHVRTASNFSYQSTDSSLLSLLEPSLQNTSSTVQDFIRTHRRTGSHNSFFNRQIHPELIAMNIRGTAAEGSREGLASGAGPQTRHTRTGSSVSYYSRQSIDSSLLNLHQGEPQSINGDRSAKTKVHAGSTYRQLMNQDECINQGRSRVLHIIIIIIYNL